MRADVHRRTLGRVKGGLLQLPFLRNYAEPMVSKQAAYSRTLRRLAASCDDYVASRGIRPHLRVLWSPGFNINAFLWVHDGLLSSALRVRGCEIQPMMCGGMPVKECLVYGGLWTGHTIDLEEHVDSCGSQFKQNCANCVRSDVSMWKDTWGHDPIDIAKRILPGDVRDAEDIVASIPHDRWHEFVHGGLPFGSWAEDAVMNNYLMAYIQDHARMFPVARSYLLHMILLNGQYPSILDEYEPDRLISHNNFYYIWNPLCVAASQRGISYYTYWMGGLRDSWAYHRDCPASETNLDETWETWKTLVLSDEQNAKLDKYLAERQQGHTLLLDTTRPLGEGDEVAALRALVDRLDRSKPTFLLASNVCWDAAALNKEAQFENMIRGVIETVKLFGRHPDYQLIVKPHPTEEYPTIPITTHRVSQELRRYLGDPPPNVFLLDVEVPISLYSLADYVDAAVVYTSTVGIEMAMMGKPVITFGRSYYRGKGFTFDTPDVQTYERIIEKVAEEPDSETDRQERIRLSRNFFFLHYFHFHIRSGMYSYDDYDNYPEVHVSSAHDILPGKNKYLDYICDSIIEGKPVFSADRWPPES